jgi:hypothetical protein
MQNASASSSFRLRRRRLLHHVDFRSLQNASASSLKVQLQMPPTNPLAKSLRHRVEKHSLAAAVWPSERLTKQFFRRNICRTSSLGPHLGFPSDIFHILLEEEASESHLPARPFLTNPPTGGRLDTLPVFC